MASEELGTYSTGRWATGSPLVRTQGSSDVDCLGLVSSSGSGTAPTNSRNSKASRARIGIIVGVTVGAFLLLTAGVAIAVILRRLRSQRSSQGTTNIVPYFEAGWDRDRHKSTPLVSSGLAPPPSGIRNASKPGHQTGETAEAGASTSEVAVAALPVIRELPPPYPPPMQYDDAS